MPNDQNSSHGRRGHYHRGRRGGERRSNERRGGPAPAEQTHRDHADVEQIMRDIRARISTRHGIDFTPQQIHELAARRLEAILEPRHARPALLEQMRRAAGEPIEVPAPPPDAESPFDEGSLYESHNGFVRALRRLLNPILKLFFNPAPIARALTAQSVRNNAAAQRESELYATQAEWNALHFEIVQRLVTELARTSLEMQSLTLRMEALDAKLDFNERRVRAMEASPQPSRPAARPVESPAAETGAAPAPGSQAPSSTGENGTDGGRRRRRRRRGRRSGLAPSEGTAAAGSPSSAQDAETDTDGDEVDAGDIGDIGPEAEAGTETTALEPAHHFSLLQPAERYPSPEGEAASPPRTDVVDHPPAAPAADEGESSRVAPPDTPPSGTDR